MDAIGHAIPILPTPPIATVFVRNPQVGLRSIDVIVEVDCLIGESI